MKNSTIIFILVLSIIVIHSCKEDDIDKEKPFIDLSIQDAFPVNCDTLYFGESFTMRVRFADNAELGSYSIDLHNNFDHHSHSTEVEECNMDPVKEPVNPYVFIQDYDIPAGLNEYVTDIMITLPSSDVNGLYDEGDYHFFISLTDAEGWSAQKGLSVKMVRR
jgi:hypothetical protein